MSQQPADAWDKIAPGYDRTNTPTQMWLGQQGLQLAGLRPGMRFLDVAAGSGALSIPAARLGARVLAIDQSPAMLELLTARARVEGLEISTRIMDGHALELDDDSFEVVGSQFGVMLFPDMPRGVREMARVVASGGRVLVTAYGDPHKIDFLAFFVGAVRTVRPDFEGPPPEPPPLPFQLQDPARLRQVLVDCSLQDPRVDTIVESTPFRNGEELWDWIVWSNPIVESILGELAVTQTERTAIRRTLHDLVVERAAGRHAATLTNPVNIGVGTKG
ncbi:MAG TPA: methyltransferase domain-containing protein [Steroidobacteraceae bacterium]|nr:methyltransferase domain-containing protein [Steroidobacteraceae bacterium]